MNGSAQSESPDAFPEMIMLHTNSTILTLSVLVALLFSSNPLFAQSSHPGLPLEPRMMLGASEKGVESRHLGSMVQEYGQLHLSLDAIGITGDTGVIRVEKPAGATVRKAYLLSATIYNGGKISAGDVKLQGNPVIWEQEVANSISSYNYWADVTAIVKPVVDAAAPGIVELTVFESSTSTIDGEILAVILDDPNQSSDNTILLYFGSQNVSGDTFQVEFAVPLKSGCSPGNTLK